MKKSITTAPIVTQEQLASDIYRLTLRAESIVAQAQPGQFVHLRVVQGHDPLLRRPFSIHRVNQREGTFQILYRVVGKGTGILAGKRPGEVLNLIGPLGRGFTADGGVELALLVAGGMGVAPLCFLAEELWARSVSVEVFLGAERGELLVCDQELEQFGAQVHSATEDGSRGYSGLVTELLSDFLERHLPIPGKTRIYACGPRPMLARVVQLAEKFSLPCQLCLEEIMACGVGACLGCSVECPPPKSGYKLVCVDGPVFEAREVLLE